MVPAVLALAGPGAGAVLAADQAAVGPAGLLQAVATALPFGYAFAAGMLAALNPCGFALLPAYLGLYLGTGSGQAGASSPGRREIRQTSLGRRLIRAAAVSAAMTASFVATFAIAGLAIAAASSAIGALFPILGLAVGVVLVLAGAYMLAGGKLYSDLGERLANRLGALAGRRGLRAYAAYGLAYGAASLGCALPIFLSVVGSSLTAHDFIRAAGQIALYGFGMGALITVLTLGVAVFQHTALTHARGAGRYLEPASALLLLLTGAYLTFYWLALGGLPGTPTGSGRPI